MLSYMELSNIYLPTNIYIYTRTLFLIKNKLWLYNKYSNLLLYSVNCMKILFIFKLGNFSSV